jgi:hypothetical protein
LARIVILFRPGGAVEFRPQGFVGRTCHEATKPYVEALGIKAQVTPGEQPVKDDRLLLVPEQETVREVKL